MRTQPKYPANGEKNSASDARYPISQRTAPRPAVSLIHCFIQVVLAITHFCALRCTTACLDLVTGLSKKIKNPRYNRGLSAGPAAGKTVMHGLCLINPGTMAIRIKPLVDDRAYSEKTGLLSETLLSPNPNNPVYVTCHSVHRQKADPKVYRAGSTGIDRMCKSPTCPNNCMASSPNARTRHRHMYRTYIRVHDQQRRQHTVPVGWWCPDCHTFLDDMR